MNNMTQQEALQEAQRRWGQEAFVDALEPFSLDDRWVYQVGAKHKLIGMGDSYGAAFADADRREREK